MDFISVEEELKKLAEEQRELCQKYYDARHNFGIAKHNFLLLLTPKQSEKNYQKASIEKQMLMLLNETPENHKTEVYEYYKSVIELEQEYKGLEKLVDAFASRISAIQSLLKWEKSNVPI